jgi:hypothetical protein
VACACWLHGQAAAQIRPDGTFVLTPPQSVRLAVILAGLHFVTFPILVHRLVTFMPECTVPSGDSARTAARAFARRFLENAMAVSKRPIDARMSGDVKRDPRLHLDGVSYDQ